MTMWFFWNFYLDIAFVCHNKCLNYTFYTVHVLKLEIHTSASHFSKASDMDLIRLLNFEIGKKPFINDRLILSLIKIVSWSDTSMRNASSSNKPKFTYFVEISTVIQNYLITLHLLATIYLQVRYKNSYW